MKKYKQFIHDLIVQRLKGTAIEDPYEQWISKNEPDTARLKTKP